MVNGVSSMASAGSVLKTMAPELVISKRKLRVADACCQVRLKREEGNQSLGFSSRPFVLASDPDGSGSRQSALRLACSSRPIHVVVLSLLHRERRRDHPAFRVLWLVRTNRLRRVRSPSAVQGES